jgi:hypothetical protein
MTPRRVTFGMSIRPRSQLSAAQLEARRKSILAAQEKPPRGERNGASKLTEASVRKIRELRAAGERPSVLALRFAVHRTLIWYVVTRRVWRHV